MKKSGLLKFFENKIGNNLRISRNFSNFAPKLHK